MADRDSALGRLDATYVVQSADAIPLDKASSEQGIGVTSEQLITGAAAITKGSVADAILLNGVVDSRIRTTAYYDGWAATLKGPVGGADYVVVTKADHDVIRGYSTVNETGDHTMTNSNVALLALDGTADVSKFGARESNTDTVNTANIQDAIDCLDTIGGGSLTSPPGITYLVKSLLPKSNITVNFNGSKLKTTAANTITFDTTSLGFWAAEAVHNLDISINYLAGETIVTMENSTVAANFAEGDWVFIRCRQIGDPGRTLEPVAELNRVRFVDGADVKLDFPLGKDYTYDAAKDYGLAIVNDTVIENFSIINTAFENLAARPLQLIHMFHCEVSDCTLDPCLGAMHLRGRDISAHHNNIHLRPDYSFTWSPHWFAVDTGCTDISFADNFCTSRGQGVIHIHEGCGNIKVSRNLLASNTADPLAAAQPTKVWPTISIKGLSWSVSIDNNIFVNAPESHNIESLESASYAGEGNTNLRIIDNDFIGVVRLPTKDNIRHTSNQPAARIEGNSLNDSIAITATGTRLINNTQPAGITNTIANDIILEGNSFTKALVTFTDGDATPSVAYSDKFFIANTSPTDVTFFDDADEGKEIFITAQDGNSTIKDSATLILNGVGVDYTMTFGDTLTLVKVSSSTWREKGRSVN